MNLNLKKLPLKALVFSIVFSLLPILVEVSPIEYSGISLQAADDDKKKKKRRRTKLPSKKATKILQQLQPLIEGELWEEMLLVLAPIADRNSKFTSTDRAKMYFYQGYIYFSIEKYTLAENGCFKSLSRRTEIPEPEINMVHWTIRLGQIFNCKYFRKEITIFRESYHSSRRR